MALRANRTEHLPPAGLADGARINHRHDGIQSRRQTDPVLSASSPRGPPLPLVLRRPVGHEHLVSSQVPMTQFNCSQQSTLGQQSRHADVERHVQQHTLAHPIEFAKRGPLIFQLPPDSAEVAFQRRRRRLSANGTYGPLYGPDQLSCCVLVVAQSEPFAWRPGSNPGRPLPASLCSG